MQRFAKAFTPVAVASFLVFAAVWVGFIEGAIDAPAMASHVLGIMLFLVGRIFAQQYFAGNM